MKILVVHVPAGAGHQKAAEAIASALREVRPDAETRLVNGLEGMDTIYRWTFTRGYLSVIHRAVWLWGAGYYLTDLRLLAPLSRRLHRLNNAWHGRAMETFFLHERPDVIVGTHFFPMEVAAALKRRGKLQARLVTILTDYLPHILWTAPGIDDYVTGSLLAEEALLARGIPQERIHFKGIPIDPKFPLALDRAQLRTRMGLDTKRLTVLVGSGGFGMGPVRELVRTLLRSPVPLEILVVAGKNEGLVRRLRAEAVPAPHTMRVFGFVDNMHELMEVSDLMITKPGGLTCAEATAKGLPLILVSPIPGQETRNARLLERMGAARVVSRLSALPALLQELQQDGGTVDTLRAKASAFSRPQAAFDIARLIVGSDPSGESVGLQGSDPPPGPGPSSRQPGSLGPAPGLAS